VGGTRIAYRRDEKCLQNFVENSEREEFEHVGRDEMIILRLILNK
jgi:hypothetical protein